jgi:hypothetical protein
MRVAKNSCIDRGTVLADLSFNLLNDGAVRDDPPRPALIAAPSPPPGRAPAQVQGLMDGRQIELQFAPERLTRMAPILPPRRSAPFSCASQIISRQAVTNPGTLANSPMSGSHSVLTGTKGEFFA